MFEYLTNNIDVANAITAISGVIIAFLAFIASTISLTVSIKSLKGQQKHNILSVKPIPEITAADYENSLRVKLRNNGNGPLFIKKFNVSNNQKTKQTVIDHMGNLPNSRPWTHFAKDLENRVIMPGNFLPLLELTQSKGEEGFDECRDLCRTWLKDLDCKLEYSDLYESNFDCYKKSLIWFGRNL